MDADETAGRHRLIVRQLRGEVLAAIRATGAGRREVNQALTQILGASIGAAAGGNDEERDAGISIAAEAIAGCAKDQALIVELGFYREHGRGGND